MIITRIAYQGIDWDAYKNTGIDIETFELQQTTLPMTESLEETTHQVMLNLENLPDNSNLSMSNKASIIHFVNGLLGGLPRSQYLGSTPDILAYLIGIGTSRTNYFAAAILHGRFCWIKWQR